MMVMPMATGTICTRRRPTKPNLPIDTPCSRRPPEGGSRRPMAQLALGNALQVEVAQRVLVEAVHVAGHRVDEGDVVERDDPDIVRPDLLNLVVQPLARRAVIRLLGLVRQGGDFRIIVPGEEIPG